MSTQITGTNKFAHLDIRPLQMKVLEAKHKLGIGYIKLKAMREELITELKKSKEGKEVLKNIKNEDIRCRLVAFVTSVKKNHPGLLESLFTAPQLPENGSLAALGRVHKLSRERIRQIRLNMVMICEDLGKTPEAVTEVTLNKLNSFLSA